MTNRPDVKELKKWADNVMGLIEDMDNTFDSSNHKAHTQIAVMAGLLDAYSLGHFTGYKDCNELKNGKSKKS